MYKGIERYCKVIGWAVPLHVFWQVIGCFSSLQYVPQDAEENYWHVEEFETLL